MHAISNFIKRAGLACNDPSATATNDQVRRICSGNAAESGPPRRHIQGIESSSAARPRAALMPGSDDSPSTALFPSDSPDAAPSQLRMASLQSKFAALWQASLEAEVPLENGGVITATPDGVVRLVNCVEYPVPNSMVFDTTLPPSHKPLGTFHTHPTQVGFHPADLAGMFGMRFAFMMLQNGTSTQSLLLATKKTPSKIDKDAISNLYSRLLMTYGPNRVSKEFALTVAKSLHLAYYEGSGGVLARVHPKLKAPDYEMLGCLARWLGKSSDDVRHGIAIFAPGYSASRYDPTEELKIDDIVHYLSATGGNYSAYDVSHWKCVPNSAIVSVTDEGGIPHTLLFERNKNGHTQLTGGNGEQYRTKNFQVSYCIALCRN